MYSLVSNMQPVDIVFMGFYTLCSLIGVASGIYQLCIMKTAGDLKSAIATIFVSLTPGICLIGAILLITFFAAAADYIPEWLFNKFKKQNDTNY